MSKNNMDGILAKRNARLPRLSASSEPFEVKILTIDNVVTDWAEVWCRDMPRRALDDLKQRIELVK